MRKAIVPTLLIAFLVPANAAAPPASSSPLAVEWERFGHGPRPECGFVPALDDGLAAFLWTDAHAHRRIPDEVGKIAETFRIGRDTASDLIEATLVTDSLPDPYSNHRPDASQVERAASAMWRAYQREPGAGIVLQQAGWILHTLGRDPAQERRFLRELAESTDPAPLAARVAWLGLCSDETRRDAVAIALSSRASHPTLLLAAAALHENDPCVSAAWAREALAAARAGGITDRTFLATARNRRLGALLSAGLSREAVDAFAEIPEGETDAALGVESSRAHGGLLGLEYEVEVQPVRSGLASAAFLVDERDLARRLVDESTITLPVNDRHREIERQGLELVRLAIDRLSARSIPDSFDVLDRALVDGEALGSGRLLATTILFVRLASESRYPEIAADLWAFDRPVAASQDAVPERIAAQVNACRARAAHVGDEFAQAVGAAGRSEASNDPGADLIARRLASPPAQVYSEHPLPPDVALWNPPDRERERLSKALAKWKLPELWPVRVERVGDVVTAIALSQDYDPAGEVSGGGYWIVRSTDGGTTWNRALYTGLRPMQPYVIRSFSHLPLMAADRLHIEVEVRELDTTKITFPPIARSFTRERKGLFLDVAWADLERDTDVDGLTDLAEERLMTDPLDPDSDRDGLPDGADSLPHISRTQRASPQAGPLAAVLREAGDESAKAILSGDPGGQGSVALSLEDVMGAMQSDAVALTSEATLFLVGDRQAFAGLQLERRIIVLSPSEAPLARARFGIHYPGTLRLFVDHSGTRAVAVWNESWRGLTLRLRNEGGVWRSTAVGSWIT